MAELPTIMDPTGLRPQDPQTLYVQLLDSVALLSPGYTSRLPGSLVEDIGSTDVGAVVMCDQARVETVNSLTPRGANAFILNQLGQIYGIFPGSEVNTSVFVVFTGPAGYIIQKGFLVSDGTNQFVLPDGGIISTDGSSPPIFAIATNQGGFAVPANTVTHLSTSVPGTISLFVTNPLDGSPAIAAETETSYRSRVLQAGLSSSQGMLRYLKTLVDEVDGVPSRLIAVRQLGAFWQVLVGGSGDPYQVGYAIFNALFDIKSLTGSTISVAGITNANPGVVTTNLNHGYVTGQTGVQINGALGMTAVNGVNYTVTVINQKSFSIGVNTTSFGVWTSGGVITPNFRNTSVNLNQYPDTYTIPYVRPPLQTVSMVVTWNTNSPNYVSSIAIAQLATPALALYVNGIYVGAPIILYELEATFQQAVASILDPQILTRMVFNVSINGIATPPLVGTGIIAGDPESFFSIAESDITVVQG